jgi:hypothetical protein
MRWQKEYIRQIEIAAWRRDHNIIQVVNDWEVTRIVDTSTEIAAWFLTNKRQTSELHVSLFGSELVLAKI